MSQNQKIVVAIIVTAIVVGGGVFLWQQNVIRVPVPATESLQPAVELPRETAPEESSETLETTKEVAAVPEGWVTYTSPLGLRFNHPKTFNRGQGVEQVTVSVSGNSVSIFPSTQPTFSHEITVLAKPSTEVVQTWIKRELLAGATSESNCNVQSTGTRTADTSQVFEVYEITSDMGIIAECGKYYLGGAVGGLWYSKQVPSKVLFISIGQDSFLGNDLKRFLDSITIQ